MIVLDLFSGLGGWSAAFVDRGHEVITVDNQVIFSPTYLVDIRSLKASDLPRPDVILASPPCERFSVMSLRHHWDGYNPRTDEAREAYALVVKTLELIAELRPRYWIIENPRAKLRTFTIMLQLERRTTTYCQYGGKYQKPTDLWGGFPPSLVLARPCPQRGLCHEQAPRGSATGMQGAHDRGLSVSNDADRKKRAALRAKVPYELSKAVCLAVEGSMAG